MNINLKGNLRLDCKKTKRKQAKMKLVLLFVVFVSVLVVIRAKPFTEEADDDVMLKQKRKVM